VDGLWATKSEGIGLTVRAISFEDFQPMPSWSANVTERQTDWRIDGRMTCNCKTALCTIVHSAVIILTFKSVNYTGQFEIAPTRTRTRRTRWIAKISDMTSVPLASLFCMFPARNMNKTAELSQRWPRDAPNITVPWKVSRVLTTHPATFPEICNGLSSDTKNVCTKFEVRVFTSSWDNRG